MLDSREIAMGEYARSRARTSLSFRDEGGSRNCFLKASLDGVGFVVRRFKAGEEVLDASVVYILDFGRGGAARDFAAVFERHRSSEDSSDLGLFAATATTA